MHPAIQSRLSTYPDWLQTRLGNYFEKLCAGLGDVGSLDQVNPSFLDELMRVWACSDYVAESLSRFPQWLTEWQAQPAFLQDPVQEDALYQRLCELAGEVNDEAALMRSLRIFRRREQVRLIWRHTLALGDYPTLVGEISALAEVCIRFALEHLHRLLCDKYGTPIGRRSNLVQSMLVMGLGKLGAHELNLSSDVDLIFAYPESGETNHPERPLDNQQFFTRLGQRLIHVLDSVTADGFVYRVDMRLRPYGGSGALVLNFASFEDYYQNQGREWERYAMIKARVVAGGDEASRAQLMKIIRPFVYRRYVDFSSFQSLRDMKRLILSEVHRKGGDQNIKLGAGGIREVEFIVQACQLIYGGRDGSLQQPGLMPVMARIKAVGMLPAEWMEQLEAAYIFLRRLEHAIQGLADKQTQMLPSDARECQRVAWGMGVERWDEVVQACGEQRQRVAAIFHEFLHDSQEAGEAGDSEALLRWRSLWVRFDEREPWLAALQAAGFEAPEASWQQLQVLRECRAYGAMSAEARERFERFLPLLMETVAAGGQPSCTLERVLSLVKVILGRTVYLVLLYENPQALAQLCHLCAESPWIAEHLAKSPVILDELVDVAHLYHLPQRDELADELRQRLLRIPEEDLEAQMDALRTFKQSHMLRVAASELGGQLPLMKVSDYLTWLAEACLQEALQICWHQMVAKHGVPEGLEEGMGVRGFAVIAYGKLGGIELSYSSDLDMVFLHDTDDYGSTNGPRPINNQQFYTRLGQKLLHMLSTRTTQGLLYETDMRLRPSGNSGMLVSSVSAFERYQDKDAWTWEHQALVRSRFIAGDPVVAEEFERVRSAIIGRQRDAAALRSEVLEMRQKMRQAALNKLGSEQAARDHIKQGEGGLIDIEFITQYGTLLYAHQEPALLRWSDNIRLLEALQQAQCFDPDAMAFLQDAYRELRTALHRKSLAGEGYQPDLSEFPETRARVMAIWRSVFEA